MLNSSDEILLLWTDWRIIIGIGVLDSMYIATIDIVSSVVWACSGRVIVVGILSLLVSLGKALSSDLGIEDLVSVLVMFILMIEPFLSLRVTHWKVMIHAIVWADSCGV